MRGMSVSMTAPRLTAQFITHLHSDHTTDYNDVITTRWIMSLAPNPLNVYGLVGTQQFTDATLAALDQDIGYRIAHHDDLNEPPAVAVKECADGLVLGKHAASVFHMCADGPQPGASDSRSPHRSGDKSVAIAGDG